MCSNKPREIMNKIIIGFVGVVIFLWLMVVLVNRAHPCQEINHNNYAEHNKICRGQ